MSVSAGKDVLLKLETGAGTGSFTSVAGLRVKTFRLNAQSLDVTHSDSPGRWRELMAGAGLKTAEVSGSGVFINITADQTLRQAFFDQATPNWQLCVPEFAILEGAFLIRELEYSGRHDDETAFALSLASAGEITVQAV